MRVFLVKDIYSYDIQSGNDLPMAVLIVNENFDASLFEAEFKRLQYDAEQDEYRPIECVLKEVGEHPLLEKTFVAIDKDIQNLYV